MGTERIDPETLAAFLDGRLEGAERDKVLRFIAEHPEEYEAFADAAHVAAELNAGGAKVIPIDRSRSRKRFWLAAIPAVIAAGIATVVVVPGLRGGGGLSPASLAKRLNIVAVPGDGSLAMRLGENWDQPGWSVTRGGEADVVEPARAFRLGARATDVEIAVRAQDSAALRLVGGDLIRLASAVDGGAPAAALYRQVVEAGSAGSASERKDAAEAVRGLMGGSPWFDLGVWIEAARVAVAAGQAGFVADHRAALQELIQRVRARPAAEGGQVASLLEELEARLGSSDAEWIKGQVGRVIVAAGQ